MILMTGAAPASADDPASAHPASHAGFGPAPLPSSNLAGAWVPMGPAPLQGEAVSSSPNSGSVSGIVPLPSGRLVIGVSDGGIWTSDDSGRTWQPRSDGQPSMAVSSVSVAPDDPAILFAGTGNDDGYGPGTLGKGVMKSTDGGSTWTTLDPGGAGGSGEFTGLLVRAVAVLPATGDLGIVAATSNGLFSSGDGGATWAPVSLPLPKGLGREDVNGLAVIPNATQGAPATVDLCVDGGGFYQSVDGGATFVDLTSSIPLGGKSFGSAVVVAAPSQPSTLYLSMADDTTQGLEGFFTSPDGGKSWSPLANTPDYPSYSYGYNSQGMGGGQGPWANAIAVDPASPQHILAGSVAAVESTDGGNSWHPVAGNTEHYRDIHPDTHALAFDASSMGFVGGDGGIYRIDDTDAVTNLNTDLQTLLFYANVAIGPTAQQVFAGAGDNGYALYAGAPAWRLYLGGDGAPTAIDPSDPHLAFATWGNQLFPVWNNQQMQSPATLLSQSAVEQDVTAPRISVIGNPASPDQPTILAAQHFVERSADGGRTWPTPTSHGGALTRVTAVGTDSLGSGASYAAWDDGTVQYSPDGGQTWSDVTPPASGFAGRVVGLAVDPTDTSTVYASVVVPGARFPTGSIWSCNSCSTSPVWTDITGDLGQIAGWTAVNAAAVTRDAVVVATDTGVYSAAPGTSQWTSVGSGLPSSPVVDLQVAPANGAIVAALNGRGAWILGSATGSPVVAANPPVADQLATVTTTFATSTSGAVPAGSAITVALPAGTTLSSFAGNYRISAGGVPVKVASVWLIPTASSSTPNEAAITVGSPGINASAQVAVTITGVHNAPAGGVTTITTAGDPVPVSTNESLQADPVSATRSSVTVSSTRARVGMTADVTVTVVLRDARGMPIPGESVSLSAGATGLSHAIVTPGSTVAAGNGSAIFHLSDTVAEAVTLTATDTTQGVGAASHPVVTFVPGVPAAATSTVVAMPASVPADGHTASILTVVLRDQYSNVVPGRLVGISWNRGAHVVVSPRSIITDAQGRAVFTVTDDVVENVTIRPADTYDHVELSSVPVTFTHP